MALRTLAVFDLDGTLVDSKESIKQSIAATVASLGPEIRPDIVLDALLAKPLREVFRAYLTEGVREDVLDKSVAHYRTIYPAIANRTVQAIPGIRDALKAIHHQGVICACGTSKGTEAALVLLRRFGLLDYIEIVLGEELIKKTKPDPEVLLRLMWETGTSANRTIMVGDSVSDIECGKNAGVVTCGVTYGFFSEEQLLVAQPDCIVRTPAALAGAVTAIANRP